MNNMFEQPLYEYEPTPAPTQESDLFHNYEVKGWMSSTGLFKVLGVSAVANIVALLVFAQTSLLTMKGCDSPLVGSVCQVLDTVYVGSLLFGTDREFVDAAYDKIDLEDADITYIDVSKEMPPFEYPADYFQIANPEPIIPITDDELAANDLFKGGISGEITENIPGITSPGSGNSLFDTPPNLPQSNPNVIDDQSLPGYSGSGTVTWPKPWRPKKPRKNPTLTAPTPDESFEQFPEPNPDAVAVKHSPSPSPSASPTPAPTVVPTDPVDANAINTRPLKDVLADVIELLDKKELDIQAPVRVLATAKLGKDGKVVKGSFKIPAAEGDKQLGIIVARTIGAFNDSNLLSYLEQLSGKDLSFLVEQDPATVKAAIKSEVESDTRASSIASAARFSLNLTIGTKEKKIKALETENDSAKAADLQKARDDLALLKSIQISTNGKEFMVGFASPKNLVQQWIQARLDEKKAEPKPTEATGGVPKTPDPAVK